MTVAVRKAGGADAAALALIGGASFLDAFAGVLDGAAIVAHCRRWHTEDFYSEWFEGGGLGWLAEARGAPVGYALVGASTLAVADPRPTDLELRRIYLLSRLHGSGGGAALMRCAVEAARGRRLLLGVHRENARALAFYAKTGFTQVGTRRFEVGHEIYDDLVLALDPETA